MVFYTSQRALLGSLILLCELSGIIADGVGAPIARKSPQYRQSFQAPLHIPSIKKPVVTYTNPKTGVPIDFYEIEIKEFKKKFFPDLQDATLLGYDGMYPGPTFRIEKGRETVIRAVNNGNNRTNIHLHGSYSRSPWDGWGMDSINPGEYKDYYYPNSINSRVLWYHDHTDKKNTINIYRGLAGMYQIVDSKLDASLGLPSGDKYDIPLILSAHYFTKTGDLSDESKERTSIYGDTFLVNGQIKPFLGLEPRKYRFRILNAAVSRIFNLTIEDSGNPITFSVIGSDGSIRQTPANTRSLVNGMAERYEIIVDFSPFSGKNLLLRTTNMWTDKEYLESDKLMQFRVGHTVTKTTNNAPLPKRFDIDIKFPSDKVTAQREFKLVSHHDTTWGVNQYHMDNPMSRVLMRPPLGTIEKYTFKSSGMTMSGMTDSSSSGSRSGSSSGMTGGQQSGATGNQSGATGGQSGMMGNHGGMMGGQGGMAGHHGTKKRHESQSVNAEEEASGTVEGELKRRQTGGMGMGNMGGTMMDSPGEWTHAIHLHLADMKILSRRKEDPKKPEGRQYLEEYERDSVKDVVVLGSNEIVEVLVKFQPYPGIYMWHCHNIVHEQNGMMGVMNITGLADLGYDRLQARLEDPMDQRFRAKPFKGTDLKQIKSTLLPFFAGLDAYPDPSAVSAVIDRYWSTRTPPSPEDTGPTV